MEDSHAPHSQQGCPSARASKRQRRSSIGVLFDVFESFRTTFRRYMLEKGFYACVIALVGIGLGTPDWMYTNFVINRFHDTDREFLPPVYAGWTKYANITVAPINHRHWYEYLIDP